MICQQTKKLTGQADKSYTVFSSQDCLGKYWFSSLSAWTVYDGFEYKTISLDEVQNQSTDTYVQSNIFCDNKSNIWFTSYEYLIKYDPIDESLFAYKLNVNNEDKNLQYRLIHYEPKSSQLWVAVKEVLYFVSPEDPITTKYIGPIAEGKSEVINLVDGKSYLVSSPWHGDTGLFLYEIDHDGNYKTKNTSSSTDSVNILNSKFLSSDKIMSISAHDIYISSIENQTSVEIIETIYDLTDITVVNSTQVLISTNGSGIFLFNIFDQTLTPIKAEFLNDNPLSLNIINDILIVGYEDIGIEYIPLSAISEINKTLDKYEFEELHKISDSLLFVYQRDTASILDLYLNSTISSPFPHSNIQSVDLLNRDNIIISTEDCIYQWNISKNGIEQKFCEENNLILNSFLFEDSLRCITKKGSISFDINTWNISKARSELDEIDYSNYFQSSEVLKYYYQEDNLDEFLLIQSKSKAEIRSACPIRNGRELFLGTDRGVYKFFTGKDSLVPILRSNDELSNASIYDLELYQESLYIVCSKGIYEYIVDENKLEIIGNFILPNSTTYKVNSTIFNDRLYINKQSTWYSYDLRSEIKKSENIDTFFTISHINMSGQNIKGTSDFLGSYNYNQNDLQVYSSFSDLYNPSDSKVKYVINDEESVTILPNEPIQLFNLQPGLHTLDITGINSLKEKIQYQILLKIESPYYQTWWFVSSSILGLIGIGFGANFLIAKQKLKEAQIKIDKQQALSTQREKIADDLHDELGTELNKILYLSDEAIENPSTAKAQELLAKIGNLAISSIHNMRDILWVLDDRHNSLRDLSNKIKSSINKTLAEYPINNTVSTQWTEDATLLESNQRQQLLLIIKESINNAIKHSHAQQIHVRMGSTDKIITIEITDDGIGFDNPNSNGRGLSSMRKRANSIDAELHINSTVGVGTTIKIEAPIIDN